MTTAFAKMAATLACTKPQPSNVRAPKGRTASMRRALTEGPKPAAQLAKVAGLTNSGPVNSLLKWDIQQGRVSQHGGMYSLVKP